MSVEAADKRYIFCFKDMCSSQKVFSSGSGRTHHADARTLQQSGLCVHCRLSGCCLCVCACFVQKPAAKWPAGSCMLVHFQYPHSLLPDRKPHIICQNIILLLHMSHPWYAALFSIITSFSVCVCITNFTSFLVCSFEAGILHNSGCNSTQPAHVNRHGQ